MEAKGPSMQEHQPIVANSLREFFLKAKRGLLFKEKEIEVDLSDDHIGPDGVKKLGKILQRWCTPSKLSINLWNNDIGNQGILFLVEAFKRVPFRKHLHLILWKNNIDAVGTQYLTGLFPYLLPESKLDISSNNMGPLGVKYLARELEKAPQGFQLEISLNHIGDAGAIYLAEYLKRNGLPKDLWINLEENRISNRGAHALLEAIRSGYAPQGLRLVLDGNKISDDLSKEIEKALIKNDIMHAALSCLVFQQIANKIVVLPPDILRLIYCLIFPFKADQKEKMCFAENVFRFFQNDKVVPGDKKRKRDQEDHSQNTNKRYRQEKTFSFCRII